MDDLIIVGAGWAGLTAAAYALDRGAKVRLIAQGIGSLIVSPGWISILNTARFGDLQGAVKQLIATSPDHPYALAGITALKNAVSLFNKLTMKIDLPYDRYQRPNQFPFENCEVITALGSFQYAALIPDTFSDKIETRDQPILFVSFTGWRDYYPALSGPLSLVIDLPDKHRLWDASPTDLARAFDSADFRKAIAEPLRRMSFQGATSLAFPAVLGLDKPSIVRDDLERYLERPIFEIPTLPPSVPGTRLFNKLRRYFLDNGVRMQIGHPVTRGLIENGRVVGVEVAAAGKPQRFYAKNVILATGGLYGGGLFSDDRGRIWEPIFNLPVKHDSDRTKWFNDNLLDPRGHPIHYIGVRANNRMQPLDEHGDPVVEGLYVAGHILAHPEGGPPPFETSEGVALATAYRAVQCALGIEE